MFNYVHLALSVVFRINVKICNFPVKVLLPAS